MTISSIITISNNLANAEDLKRHDIKITIADDSDSTKRIVENLQKKFITAQVITNINTINSTKKKVIYIAVGPSALRALLAKNLGSPTISVFTSSQAYRAILENSPKHRHTTVTAIFAEPSPFDQLQLISALYKRRVSVATLISDKNTYLVPMLHRAASRANINLIIERISDEDNINRVLNSVATVPVILALPDSTLYSVENIRNILVTTYRHNQSIIGFSTSLVKAGALASAYSSIEDIVAQLDELINELTVSGRIPEPQFPKYFSVTINDSVAKSLNLVIDDSIRALSRQTETR
jgi:ABC-type uncharacterized transport system substrate-binding protein